MYGLLGIHVFEFKIKIFSVSFKEEFEQKRPTLVLQLYELF